MRSTSPRSAASTRMPSRSLESKAASSRWWRTSTGTRTARCTGPTRQDRVRASRLPQESRSREGNPETGRRPDQVEAEAGEAGLRTANQGKGEGMKTNTRKKKSTVTESGGNVFADMGVPEPEQAL